MESSFPIRTALGELHGRDALYLDRCTQTDQHLEFEGEVNGALCGDPSLADVFIAYRLRFFSVQAFDARGLDLCPWDRRSSFDEVRNSEWLETLGTDARHHHYALSTYDVVYRIAATHFEFEVLRQAPR